MTKQDPQAEQRKQDHISLAFESAIANQDSRFYYEPMLSGHALPSDSLPISVAGRQMQFPIWISSMTGGTALAKTININLAKAAQEFGLGMGLGSCRQLLDSKDRLQDFDIRKYMPDQPLFANLGIAQVQELVASGRYDKLKNLIADLQADGLILHINPLQEWLQPEGDRYYISPILTLQHLLDKCDFPLIVKEVGQGMGPKSLEALLKLPLEAVEYGAHGGTNFSMLELLRANEMHKDIYTDIANVGHSAIEMTSFVNTIVEQNPTEIRTKTIIASGGINTFLDGYYHISKLNMPSIYAQASAMLRYATGEYSDLQQYVKCQCEGLNMAKALFKVR